MMVRQLIPSRCLRHAIGLLVWVVVLFGSTLDHGFHYDDAHSILDNPRLQDWRQIPSFFVDPGAFSIMPQARMYRPMLLSSYAVTYALGGGAVAFHLVNLALHAIVVLLFWRLARHLGSGESVALALAAIYAAHPLVSEPVNYISSRSSSLSTMFTLAAVLCVAGSPSRWQALRLAGWTAAAVLTKATGLMVLPISILYLLLTRQAHRWRLVVGSGLVVLAYVVGTRAIIGKALGEPVRGLISQLSTQSKAIGYYLQTLIMPTGLSVEPQFSVSSSFLEIPVLMTVVLTGSLLAVIWAERGQRRLVSFGSAWFLLALAPTLVVPLHVLVNDHRLYAALPGALLGLGAVASRLRVHRQVVVVGLAGLFAILTFQRNADWSSPALIWEKAIARGPRMPRSHINLGKVHLEAGDFEQAIRATQSGLRLDPGLARGHYNVATAYLHLGRYEQSIAGFERALEIDPAMAEAWNNLGNVYKELGRSNEAVESYHRALDLTPQGPVYHNLGSAYLAAAAHDSAALYFEQALRRTPDKRETHIGMARALRRAGRLLESQRSLTVALKRWPMDGEFLALLAHTQAALGRDEVALTTFGRTTRSQADIRLQLGKAALGRGDWQHATSHFEAGLVVAPEDGPLHNALGEARWLSGDQTRALELFRRAARLEPDLSDAYRNIGLVNLRHGRHVEALAALERALHLESEAGDSFGQGRTWELIARAQEGQKDWPAAIAAYTRAIEREPTRAILYHNLGVLTERVGSQPQAERLYREALARDPSLHESRHSLGHLLLVAGHVAEAVKQIETLLAAQPAHAEAHINLATARVELGDTVAAISAYERYLQLHLAEDATRQRVQTEIRRLRRAGPE
ncbi:MAG: tetratricopeptide repeat protein [Gemmatimonadetes bacterium]|nr:tetratricopeptide repeat protein [Gemmatimonadota bacterium]MBT6148373.1 tetratricopeptide repeat protein [Gemmatimonadota bacterium]MBT7859800.1 tetratricopeptide repeat protein [Gemmatimonadota bacterium]